MPRYPFPVRVRARLHMLGKTQSQLAAALGYSPSYLSMYLSGKLPYPPDLRPGITEILRKWENEDREKR